MLILFEEPISRISVSTDSFKAWISASTSSAEYILLSMVLASSSLPC